MSQSTDKTTWRWTTRLKLRAAGWRPNRNVWDRLKLPQSLSVFPEAKRILAEFGDLRFSSPAESVHLDPSVGEEIADQIKVYEKKLGRPLYPVGILEGGDTLYLLVDDKGLVYALSDQLEPFASSFERAIGYLVRHVINGREMKDDLQAAGVLGKVWKLD